MKRATFQRRDKVCERIIQWGPYGEAQYGDDFDWEWDPPGDNEWVAAVYRFYWAAPLVTAYAPATRDEKYAPGIRGTFNRQDYETSPGKSPPEPTPSINGGRDLHGWISRPGFGLPISVRHFAACCTPSRLRPEFLGLLMASLYDHPDKNNALFPMGLIHNKAVFEQRGFINVAYTFSQFRESRDWMELGLARTEENILAQTTADGVQREWSFGYHQGVLRDAVEIFGPRGRLRQ